MRRTGSLATPDNDHLIESGLGTELVFDGALLKVRRDRVRLPNGGEAIREYVVHPGAVLIVPILPDGPWCWSDSFAIRWGR